MVEEQLRTVRTRWGGPRVPWVPALGLVMAAAVAGGVAGLPQASGQSTEDCPVTDYAMGLRYQQSANAAAAQQQAWLLATERLQQVLADRRRTHQRSAGGVAPKPLAVVTDLDETVLDNTALLARDLEACHTYTTWDTWADWELHGDPLLTPGAREFLQYADSEGVAVYYVSDRFSENIEATMATLRDLGLPQVSRSHVLLYGPTKEERRAVVAADHEIALLLGDSLPDFADAFDGATPSRQHELAAAYADHWGRDWIMFPNAAYGGWRKAPFRSWDAPLVTG